MSDGNAPRYDKEPHLSVIADAQSDTAPAPLNDYFVECDGARFAGLHLIIDFWGAKRLDDLKFIEATLREAVDAAGATLLHIHLHHFTENNGVSGVAVLAESHISIHSWPEHDYAALDIFMCGETEPQRAVDVLRQAFDPDRVEIGEHHRGRL
ncbi:MAG: adenosylmethionine decarboxylase [Alphaproteobacteria bacterium]|nr:adenosylmethionine decarboxylase [Alphaproteobacteria bacterium]